MESSQLISKKVLLAGIGDLPRFTDGSKAIFHFRTQTKGNSNEKEGEKSGVVVDDSRLMERPMEFIFGKKFKLEAWETCIATMRVKEVSEFTIDKSLVVSYPLVSKMVRSAFGGDRTKKEEHSHHCCGMMAIGNATGTNRQLASVGHADLDRLVANPCDLVFTFELLDLIGPDGYEKESWALDDGEKLLSVPKLRAEGNELYRDKRYEEASKKYAEALGRLEQLLIKEKPGDEQWTKLDEMKIPLLLNYSQCKLIERDFYPVIEHTTYVLERDPDNVKALYRRAQAHVRVWNKDEAREDFERVRSLDPSLAKVVDREISNLDEEIRRKNREDGEKLLGKIFSK